MLSTQQEARQPVRRKNLPMPDDSPGRELIDPWSWLSLPERINRDGPGRIESRDLDLGANSKKSYDRGPRDLSMSVDALTTREVPSPEI